MTINVLRGKARRGAAGLTPASLTPAAIDEADEAVFSCPACARPLVFGASRCPGCRTRLVMGIQLGRASLFLTLGVALGSLVGGGLVAFYVQDRLDMVVRPVAANVIPNSAPTDAAPLASAPTVPTVPVSAIPGAAIASLGQTALVNARLADAAGQLSQALASEPIDTAVVASALRAITTNATSALSVTSRLGTWPAAADLADDMRTFYADARSVARTGLGASLANEPAYREAARSMLAVLGSLGTLDAESRLLAEVAGVTLPPVDLPTATDAAGPTGPGSEPLP